MASNSSKKNKSSGLRILWIPGRKSHPKGRLSSTNKQISYSPTQKKSEVWSLGGSKAQTELIDLPSPEISGASTSSSLALLGGMSSTLVKSVKGDSLDRSNITTPDDAIAVSECATLPTTPIAAITPNLNSPLSELAPSTASTAAMPSPIVVTTVEILDLHSILNPDDLPKVPSLGEADISTAVGLNSSAGTTASIATNSSPLANCKAHNQTAVRNSSPHKSRYRNHNNNQDDINSIESISSFNRNQISSNFEWIDEMVHQRNCSELMHKNKRKKSKRSIVSQEMDQLDGRAVKEKHDTKSMAPYDDNDEKVVKCLYYSLMCCDCTIS
ncbi:uncharacterized protein LOC6586303 isoform X1 [Drosophila mojavensis]|uniref:Uncharacterized protein, isoform A n=2 Tax=Drosophila mojavensis TaxID=7230 RepID=B4L8R5_DROMO|nr:uncharacterized protein LOC6586303 isoform X1 [Drosophila mojavensis]XP_015015987.1 uncharacterized protein LOC6586303 isoform X1 [Drosophila mojavensis]EDW08040.1 uncharacterized protein Dmoj_GI14306, isoform A [Drosophila mojavensis]KRG07568.1 uncharacterized protein Dmoj_GI14306, isoform B [Drosophila mojavensis]